MSGLDLETYYGKISKSAKVFNKLDPEHVKDAIEVAIMQFNKYSRDITNVHMQNEKLDMPYSELRKKVAPIEYVIEEEKEKKTEIIPLNRKNIENIQEKASGGDER